jgi:cell division protein FtsB
LTYSGDRPAAPAPPTDARDAIDQLETILREVAEELAGWRSRAQKAEAELKSRGGGGGTGGAPVRNTELESENKALRQRVEGARTRVHDLMQRLTFLEEQAKENGGHK